MLSALLMLAGCGYHFASSGSGLPQDAKTIYVARFSNTSRFTGYNDRFMRYMKDQIADLRARHSIEASFGAAMPMAQRLSEQRARLRRDGYGGQVDLAMS